MMTTDQTKCQWCHRDYADHNYQPVEQTYLCPFPYQESGYGGYKGGDPRNFHPDYECCTPEEIASWKAACEEWDEADENGELKDPDSCPSGWEIDPETNRLVHVSRYPFGIGTYTFYIQTEFEAVEEEETWRED